MPVLVRRRPSLDLRKAAKASEDASKFNPDSFSFEDSDQQRSEDDMDLPKHKLAKLPSRQKLRGPLRLATSSPVLHQQYQSDEEQPSPTPEDAADGSEYMSCYISSEEEYETDPEEEFDFEDDFDTPLALPVIFAAAKAVAMSIQVVGRPCVVSVTALAPMAKRTVPLSRPESASYTTLRRVKAPSPTAVRTSFYETTKRTSTRNFSTPLQRSDSGVPSQTYSGLSPSSSLPSLNSEPVLEMDEADLLIRESDEIQVRSQHVLAGTEWDLAFDNEKPMCYEDHDPFALQPPTLRSPATFSFNEPGTPSKTKPWSRLGLKSRLMGAGKKLSKA